MTPRLEIRGDEFKVDIYQFDGDHQKIVKEELEKSKLCVAGYEILFKEYFMFGCPVLGVLPGDCRGTSYIGKCTEVLDNL